MKPEGCRFFGSMLGVSSVKAPETGVAARAIKVGYVVSPLQVPQPLL
jgi:hypothetical protein